MATQCEMIIGFLVPHRCEKRSLGSCVQCSRTYCEEHVTVRANGLVCVACEQGLDRPVALPSTARDYSDEDLAAFTQASMWADDDSDVFADLS